MLIKSVKLKNIRSYENQEIKFPVGSVLLAGDIGSGKSTILLAIEFALFGAKKGELPAYTLLRHGKKEGGVELVMKIDNKDILIKRTLKRSNEDIKQDAGYVVVNGIKKEGTAEELRAVVLDLLGYPQNLVKKGKDLVYRYTVYTPQEEMKQILYEGEEARLDTLRKVFNIDKYKRVKENAKIIVVTLRENKKHIEGFTLDLEYKKKDLEERKSEVVGINMKISRLMPKIDEIKRIINEKKTAISKIENDIKELTAIKKELSVAEAELNSNVQQNNRLNDEITKLEKQIEELKKELENKNLDDLKTISKKIEEKEKELNESDLSYRNTIKKIKELEVKIETGNDSVRKIQELEICPLCEQKVNDDHKHNIRSRESRKHVELIEQLKAYKEQETNIEQIKIQLKKELDNLLRQQNHLNILKIRFDNLKEKLSAKEERLRLKERIKKEIGMLNSKKYELSSKIAKYSEAEEKYKVAKQEIEGLLPQERFLEIEKGKYEAEIESTKRFVSNLEKEIYEKQKAKEKLNYISQLIIWIDEFFLNLMSTMEKHVMVTLHSQFNELFKSWFEILLEDETISVRVDEVFTPIIEQNGYETFIENLSGGERTSVALSYRLALNKVVNDVVASIKTKDIIILDEPTDGFSTEQLDKIRDVLEQLNTKQTIIVSHESKIESFVDHVIRIYKQDNISIVL